MAPSVLLNQVEKGTRELAQLRSRADDDFWGGAATRSPREGSPSLDDHTYFARFVDFCQMIEI